MTRNSKNTFFNNFPICLWFWARAKKIHTKLLKKEGVQPMIPVFPKHSKGCRRRSRERFIQSRQTRKHQAYRVHHPAKGERATPTPTSWRLCPSSQQCVTQTLRPCAGGCWPPCSHTSPRRQEDTIPAGRCLSGARVCTTLRSWDATPGTVDTLGTVQEESRHWTAKARGRTGTSSATIAVAPSSSPTTKTTANKKTKSGFGIRASSAGRGQRLSRPGTGPTTSRSSPITSMSRLRASSGVGVWRVSVTRGQWACTGSRTGLGTTTASWSPTRPPTAPWSPGTMSSAWGTSSNWSYRAIQYSTSDKSCHI